MADVEEPYPVLLAVAEQGFAPRTPAEDLGAAGVRILVRSDQEIVRIEGGGRRHSEFDAAGLDVVAEKRAQGTKSSSLVICGEARRATPPGPFFSSARRSASAVCWMAASQVTSSKAPPRLSLGACSRLGGVDGDVGIPALVAHPVAVDILVVAGLEALDAAVVVARVESFVVMYLDVAPAAATRADGRASAEEPDAAPEAEIAVGQSPDRADVDHIARIGVVERLPGKMSISLRCPRSTTHSSPVLVISCVKRTQRVQRMQRS